MTLSPESKDCKLPADVCSKISCGVAMEVGFSRYHPDAAILWGYSPHTANYQPQAYSYCDKRTFLQEGHCEGTLNNGILASCSTAGQVQTCSLAEQHWSGQQVWAWNPAVERISSCHAAFAYVLQISSRANVSVKQV